MRTIWSCSSCVLLLFALLGGETSASHAGRQWKDVHRVPKAQVTAPPLRRDEGTCPAEHASCPASLSGGCCPPRYACAVDSCYATTAGPTTACGKAGYFACAAADGGGCCPVGYVCGKGACIPPAGVSDTYLHCPTDYFLCPSTLNYGCCRSGMGCARSACYSTEPVTKTITQTVTTTSGSATITTTATAVTVATPTPPSGLPTDGTDVAAKFIPTSVPKVPVTSSTSNSGGGGGLSGGAIGGIIAGVVVLLIVVVVAAFLIIRRLKHVEEIMESKQGSSSGKKSRSQSQAQMAHYGRQLHSPTDMDDMSVDPLMSSSNTHNNSIAGTPQPVANTSRARSDSAGFTPSPNMVDSAHTAYASPDSNLGYFDIIPGGAAAPQQQQQPMTARMRNSTDSAATATTTTTTTTHQQHRGYASHSHWRQQSNTSELSADGSDNGANASVFSPLVGGAGDDGGGGPAELDASGRYAELPDYGPGAHDQHRSSVGMGAAGVRSRSGSAASVRGHGYGQVRRRSDGVQGQGQQPPPGPPASTASTSGPGLAPLEEVAEMHGYYGGRNQQAGQTAAGLMDP